VTGLAAIATTTPAHAVLQIALELNGGTFTCVDNASCDLNSAVGTINVGTVSVNGIDVAGTFQTQKIAGGVGQLNALTTSSFTITNTNTTTAALSVAVGGTNFQGPVSSFTASGNSDFTGAIGSNIQLIFYGDTSNTQGAASFNDTPGTALATSPNNTVTTLSQSFSFNQSGQFLDPDLFSLTLFATANLTPGASLTNRTQSLVAVQIPEPSSLVMLSGSLFAMWLVRRRLKAA